MLDLRLDSSRWWALATFLIPFAAGFGQLIWQILLTLNLASSQSVETVVVKGAVVVPTLLCALIPFRWARAVLIACLVVLAIRLVDWIFAL